MTQLVLQPSQRQDAACDTEDAALLRQAMRHHRAGQLVEAAAVLERLLGCSDGAHASRPETKLAAQAQLLLALVWDDLDDVPAATAAYERYLQNNPVDGFALHRLGRVHQRCGDDAAACQNFAGAVAARPDHAPTLNDFATTLYRLGEAERALAAFDRSLALDPGNPTSLCNRGKLLAALHRAEDGTADFRAVLALPPRSASDWHDHATAAHLLNDLETAEASCRRAIADDPQAPSALQARLLLADILDRTHRRDAAHAERSAVCTAQGVTRRRCLGAAAQARVLLVGGAGLCNLPTDFLIDRRIFETVTVFVSPTEQPLELLEADIAFNIVGEADAPFLAEAAALLARLPCPVLNLPHRVPPTGRDRLPALLAGIPGLLTPPVLRVSRNDLAAEPGAVADRLGLPVLVRPVGSHGGVGLRRADTVPDLAEAIAATPTADCFVSRYVEYRSADGWFRKYRLVFVDGEMFPVHLAIGADWLVHYWRVAMADWMQHEEDAFLADHRSVFGGIAGEALQLVASGLGLDYGGIDCALLPDGRVLVFEANAAMLVHVNGVSPAKRRQAERVRDAVSRLILRRARPNGRARPAAPPE